MVNNVLTKLVNQKIIEIDEITELERFKSEEIVSSLLEKSSKFVL